jgi:uncharacterized iron-regulated protein
MSSREFFRGRLKARFLRYWQSQSLWLVVLAGLATMSSGCDANGNGQRPPNSSTPGTSTTTASQSSATNASFDDRQIIKDFADQVVIPTNQLFAKRAEELSSAVNRFVKNPNDQTLKAAQDAWVAARSPWEQSECFGFGPAESLGYDAALDSWPVNETDLKAAINSKDKVTSEYVKKRQDTEKGFHVIEYLLFGNDKSKKATDFNKRELDYLQALSTDFSQVANDLVTSWTKGVEGNPAYREVIATAGDSRNSTYPSLQAGAEEMVQGMIDSLDEVANEKIAKPFEEKDQKWMESRFSFNTLNDLKSNVKGAENVYLGRFPDANTSGTGLTAYVAKVNPDLDARVKSELQASVEALEKIPAPFEKSVTDPQAADEIESAQKVINTLQETIKQEVLPLVKS